MSDRYDRAIPDWFRKKLGSDREVARFGNILRRHGNVARRPNGAQQGERRGTA